MAHVHYHGPLLDPQDPDAELCTRQRGCPDNCTHIECRELGKLFNCQYKNDRVHFQCWHESEVTVETLTKQIEIVETELERLRIDLEVFQRTAGPPSQEQQQRTL